MVTLQGENVNTGMIDDVKCKTLSENIRHICQIFKDMF